MLSRLRLPLALDVEGLQRDAAAIAPEHWVPHFNRAGYSGDWSGAPLRSIGGVLDRISLIQGDGEQWADTPLMAECPAAAGALAGLSCDLLAVRFLRLGSGASVLEHSDGGLGYEDGELRIHVPVSTNPGVEFRHAGRVVEMRPGEAWYLNLDLPHSVQNQGASDRVHLLIDCRRNEWLDQLFVELAADELTRAMSGSGGATIWLSGREGAGRTALATELGKRLALLGQPASIIDDEPGEWCTAVASPSDALAEAIPVGQRGELAVVGVACSSMADRQRAREAHERAGLRFVEVFVDCQREVCDVRVKLRAEGGGGAARARSQPELEPPTAPEVTVRSDRETVGEEAEIVLTSLLEDDPLSVLE